MNFTKTKFITSCLILSIIAIASVFPQSTELTDTLARIESHINLLSQRSESGRIIGGWTMVGMGALVAGIGIPAVEFSDLSREDKIIMELALGGSGAILTGIGIVSIAVPGESERVAKQFNGMPQRTDSEIMSKIRRGEVFLQTLAQRAEKNRHIIAISSIAAGIGEIVTYFMMPEYGDEEYMLYSVLGTGIGACLEGIVYLIFKSEEELEWDSYSSWKRDHGYTRNDTGSALSLAITPRFGGINLAARLSF
ncbi:MAG: hypothetical protein EHM28_11600 [Spirochaetaceae bacterium]|nr:MAG: hypothetical protein EHM28_11600 [Spirochaetaceae bacterium]